MEEWLAWGIFAVICLLVIAFSGGFIMYYKWKDDPAGVTGTVGFFALLFTLLSLFLIPIDVYLATSTSYPTDRYNDVKYTYYAFYIIFMFFVFVGLPFAYFYYEELGDTEDRNNTFSQRACQALKYTSVFIFTWVVLLCIGLFVDFKNSKSDSDDTSSDDSWESDITGEFKSQESKIIPVCMAVLICIGLFFSMIYTAWGMASFPISVMRSIPVSNVRRKESIELELRNLEANLRHMRNKYRGRTTDMTSEDRERKKTMEDRKKMLETQKQHMGNTGINGSGSQDNCCDKCGRCIWTATAPVRYILGILMTGWSAVLISSIVIHLIDQIVNSSCGYSCGFAIEERKLSNPIGIVLTETSKVFPFDYIVFGMIVFWLFWSTIVGVMMIDVRFLCFKLFSLRPHGTMHNALMMAIMFIILIVCSFTYNIYNLAPDYVQYGHQTHCKSSSSSGSDIDTTTTDIITTDTTGSDTTTSDTTDDSDCNSTVVYNLITGIMIGMPIFGLIYFIFSWIFVAVSILSFVVNILRKPKPGDQLLNENDDLEPIFRE